MKNKNNKIIVGINIISVFLFIFLFSFIYEWFPNVITAALFPINESLFEHLKLMYITQILIGLIIYIFIKLKNISINNYFLGLYLSTICNILIYFIIYLPIYNRFGQNLFGTMLLYLITLILSNLLLYYFINKKNINLFNTISLLLIPITWFILIYFTFNPPLNDFFFDPIEEKYGINIYIKEY